MSTTVDLVRAVIETDGTTDLEPFLRTASALVTHISSKDNGGVLTPELLIEIETYLAAHFYALYDPQYQTVTTGKASSTYQGMTGKGLELTWWGQQAVMLDLTGELRAISNGKKKASILWLGTEPTATEYE
jgi:hypothetical protein